jgi:2-C-methyl-D-erythritol 2,4-cyclodiphosphate synthase
MTVRVGHGFDVHPFGGDGPLVLGGVVLEGQGLIGHSDADVVCHAVIDALLGASGLGDIGQHFAENDPAWEGANSVDMLTLATGRLADAGWRVGNVDCTVVLELPRLAPVKERIQERLTAAVGAPVSVKAKTAEGLGPIGRKEGIACWAVALVESVDQA